MNTPLRFIAGLIALACWSFSSASDAQPRDADPEASLNEALIVRAPGGGPAWWKVSDEDSTVWVLGLPPGLSRTVKWDDRLLQTRLARADALILPPDMRPSPIKALVFFIKHRKDFRSRQPMEQTLPEPLARRFAESRERLGKPASRYSGWSPLAAAMVLAGDTRKPARFDQDEPLAHIRAVGSRAGVRERRPGGYGNALLNGLTAIPQDAQLRCVEDSVDEAEGGAERITAAGRGWAAGDVRGALGLARGYDRCLAAIPAISALLQRGQADTAAAIRAALERPGHTVAVVELRALLARGGVLDQVRGPGISIQTPDKTAS